MLCIILVSKLYQPLHAEFNSLIFLLFQPSVCMLMVNNMLREPHGRTAVQHVNVKTQHPTDSYVPISKLTYHTQPNKCTHAPISTHGVNYIPMISTFFVYL